MTDAARLAEAAAHAGANGKDGAREILERAAEWLSRRQHGADDNFVHDRHDELSATIASVHDVPVVHDPTVSLLCSREEKIILNTIHQCGRSQAITAQELGVQIEADPRRVRAIVAHLRGQHGEPICSVSAHRTGEPAGYFWPDRVEDADSTLAQLESRRVEIEQAVTGMRAGVRRVFGTVELPFGETK